MTQEDLKVLLLRLKCCSGEMGADLATKLANGYKGCSITNLIILNNYVNYLLKYTINGNNCITSKEFDTMINSAKESCRICDCE